MRSRIGSGLDARPAPPRGIWNLREIATRKLGAAWPQAVPPASEATYPELVLADRPLGYWRLNDSSDLADQSGNSHHGTLVGTLAQREGALTGDTDGALDFPGSPNTTTHSYSQPHVVLPSAISQALAGTTSLTWEGWIYLDSVPTEGDMSPALVSEKFAGGEPVQFTIMLNAVTAGAMSAGIYTGSTWVRANDPTPLLAGQWYHFVGTYDGATIRFYKNGALVASTAHASTIPTSPSNDASQQYMIGHRWDQDEIVDGAIDEVAVYGRVLTEHQIRRHYYRALGHTGYPLDVLADGADHYWRMDDLSSPLIDVRGFAPATISGTPTFGIEGVVAEDEPKAIEWKNADYASFTMYTMSPTASSAEFWFNKPSWDANDYNAIVIGLQGNGNSYIHLLNATTIRVQANDTGTFKDFTVPSMATNAWHHVVVVRISNTLRVYVNGVQSTTGAHTLSSIMQWDRIARYGSGDAYNYVGKLDEMSLYSVALSPAQAFGHHLRGLGLDDTLYHDAVVGDGAVHYWRMDTLIGSNVTDVIGTRDATVVASFTNYGQRGALATDPNPAFDFLSGGYVTVPAFTSLPTSFTYELWFKLDSVSTDQSVRQYLTSLQSDPPTVATYTYIQRQGMMVAGDILQVQYYSGNNSSPSAIAGASVLQTGVWYHVVLTGDASGVELYLNGALEGSNATAPVSVAVNEWLLGARNDGQGSDYFTGWMDEFAYYPVKLTPGQVQDHFTKGIGAA